MKNVFAHIIFIVVFASLVHTSNAQTESFVVRNVNVIDVENGKAISNQDVFIENGRIFKITRSNDKKSNLKTIDGGGKFLIPGLWDFHVHALALPNEEKFSLPVYVANGITGIRDLGSFKNLTEQKNLAESAENNKIISPRIVLTGAIIDGPPGAWQGIRVAKTREDGIREANKLLDEGWQYLKTYSLLPLDAYLGVAEVAKKRNVPLIGHIPDGIKMMDAVNAGHKAVEHIDKVLLGCSSKEDEVIADRAKIIESGDLQQLFVSFRKHKAQMINSVDWKKCEQLAEKMAKNKMFVSPTMIVIDFYLGKDPPPTDPRFRFVPEAIKKQWTEADRRRMGRTQDDYDFAAKTKELDLKLLKILQEKGVGILASSDAAWINPYIFHGFSVLDEIERYVNEAKLTPAEALQTATLNPAKFLGKQNEFGKIETGFVADLVLLEANPLEDIKNIRRINTVILRGKILDRVVLDGLLRDVEKNSATVEQTEMK